MIIADLGDTEVVTSTQANPSRAAAHIIALEYKVDELTAENKQLRKKLKKKPTVITQEEYDRVCKLLQEAYNESLPF